MKDRSFRLAGRLEFKVCLAIEMRSLFEVQTDQFSNRCSDQKRKSGTNFGAKIFHGDLCQS